VRGEFSDIITRGEFVDTIKKGIYGNFLTSLRARTREANYTVIREFVDVVTRVREAGFSPTVKKGGLSLTR